ncbi:MAG TPA: SDR family oxidoreductase [Pyrinomonadaceae bacterium]|jgi:gluconate 5-dehydrogenase|nr:SDR family oxidoreductase [Pyrinomonadaceae bacterium]
MNGTSSFDLHGRNALITGGGSGLGFAIAKSLAAAGASVILLGRNQEKLGRASEELVALGANATYTVCDLLDRNAIAPLIQDLERNVGPLDILLNNAGVQQRAPFTEFPAEGWDRMMATHISAPFFLTQAIARQMIIRGRGKIINTLSIMSELGRPMIVPYTTAKGGLKMLTRGLAVELGAHNIQVNGIAPGYFRTEMNQALMDDPKFDAWVKQRTPAQRWGEPDEIGGAAVFLASGASDFVTGQIIFVDGGFTASV